MTLGFKENFLWGGALSANQVEGAYLEGERAYPQQMYFQKE